jgi:hypothetical protein
VEAVFFHTTQNPADQVEVDPCDYALKNPSRKKLCHLGCAAEAPSCLCVGATTGSDELCCIAKTHSCHTLDGWRESATNFWQRDDCDLEVSSFARAASSLRAVAAHYRPKRHRPPMR